MVYYKYRLALAGEKYVPWYLPIFLFNGVILNLWRFNSMRTRLQEIFYSMKKRCYNPNCSRYKYYGAKGITICDEWLNNPNKFYQWSLSNGYNDKLTIDRIDNNKGYEPNNCRWVSQKLQANNKSNNHFVTYKGKRKTVAQWCEELNLNYGTAVYRLNKLKWSVEKVFESTDNTRLKMIHYNEECKPLFVWCKELNLNYHKIKDRLNKLHWSVEKAFETK